MVEQPCRHSHRLNHWRNRTRNWTHNQALRLIAALILLAGMAQAVQAQSGGRARGGSFDQPAPSQAPSQAPARNYPSGGYSAPYDYSVPPDRYYRRDYGYPGGYGGGYRRSPVIVAPPQSYDPYGYGTGYGTSSSGDGMFLILVLFCGFTLLPIAMAYLRQMGNRGGGRGGSSGQGELANDIVTVTQVQVALLAQARYIQEALTQLSTTATLNSQTGLSDFLRETVLALLRNPEYWSHAKVSSQTVRSRQQASQLFEQLSIQERSKLSAETLVNVQGQIRRQALKVPDNADPASYIVVTLLVGTADDKPIAQPVHSAEELTAILKRLGGIAPSYLLIYELIWSPQDASDSLSRDQLLAHYPDLVQIA